MKRIDRRSLLLATAAALCTVSCRSSGGRLRIGWQAPLATQGEIASILQRTDILKQHSLMAEFSAFSFGTPQMEAARAGAIDVALVGDQPLINLICAGSDWKILCWLFDTRVCLFRNAARQWRGPRGAVFASPKGSVADREVYYYLHNQGLDPSKDVTILYVDAAEISALLDRKDWGEIDAIAIWEPLASQFEARSGVVNIYARNTLGVVGVSPSVYRDAQRVDALRASILDAWRFFIANEDEAHQWYREAASNRLDDVILHRIARINRNFSGGHPDIALTAADRKELARSMEWAHIYNPALAIRNVSDIVIS
jgi:ABC-type nitrate/sulfonate/bicarbonate transport system substrate-binding protein